MELRAFLTHIKDIRRVPFEGGPEEKQWYIEHPEVETWQIETTMSVPHKAMVLFTSDQPLSGFRMPDGPTIAGPRYVLLMVKPTIVKQ